MAIERSNLVALLDELEGRGWIARTRPADDRRTYALMPTSAGTAICARAAEAVGAHDDRMTATLTGEERRAMMAALEAVEGQGGNGAA